MNIDDVIYLVCLLSCIGLGIVMRKIQDSSLRKLIGTSFGLLIVFIVSGLHILHCFISFGLCAAAILYVHPSKCHLVSFGIMFGYLAFFRSTTYFGLPAVPGHTNMIQMILTLKAAGLAFEKNASYNRIQKAKEEADKKENVVSGALTEYDVELQSIGLMEMVHYSFNYIGVLTGPYYRYRTYRDYFTMPFKDYAESNQETLRKLKYIPLYCVLYVAANYVWPLGYALSDEFYQQRSFLYRLFYVWPTFFIFRMRIYTGLTLSECVCTCAGFGAYPDSVSPTNGEGPTKPYDHLKNDKTKQPCNFITIVNLRAKATEECTTMREAMKHWNVCVQYWLAVNVYKRFPSKKYRTIATLLLSSFWHGFMAGHYLCIMGAVFYVPVEDMIHKLYRKDARGTQLKVMNALFWFSKFFALSYLSAAFLLLSFQRIWFYYSSIYHFGYLYWAVLMVFAVIMTNRKRAAERREKKAQEAGEKESKPTEAAIGEPINSENKEKLQ